MFGLRLLGGAHIEGDDGVIGGQAGQPRRIALLALLATAPNETISRDKLVALLWPESDEERGRHALSECFYVLRKALGEEAILSKGANVRLNREIVSCDVVEFEAAVECGDLERAVFLHAGPFLDGFHLKGTSEFQRWIDSERDRLVRAQRTALENLAEAAEQRGDLAAAVEWWQRLSAEDPYSSRVALRLMQALVASGNRAAALQHARTHADRVREDLGGEPDPEVEVLAARLAEPEPHGSISLTITGGQQPADHELVGAPEGASISASWLRSGVAVLLLLGGLGAIALWVAVAAGWFSVSRGAPSEAVATEITAAGPGVAVLPFRVAGSGLELWREGMSVLLALNFDDVDGLRKIDPRAVLSRWEEEVGGGEEASDIEEALNVARGIGARYAILGSIVGLGADVRISADVYDVLSGQRISNSVRVEGPTEDVLTLVDELSSQLLRTGILAGASDIPELAVARLTTGSQQALIAYLEGEQEYRRSNFREAIPHFNRAIEADPTFALALYRLSESYAWIEAITPRVRELARAAAETNRLPGREALLLIGTTQVNEFRLSAIETLEELTGLYPDDVEGWFKLGEAYFFLGDAGLHSRERFRYAFRRAVELDPRFGQPYHHLADDAFHRQDDVEVRALIATLREIDPASHEPIGLALSHDMVWGDSLAQARALAAMDTAHTDVIVSAMRSLLWATDYRDRLLPIALALTEERHLPGSRAFGHQIAANCYLHWGQVSRTREHLAQTWPVRQLWWDLVLHLAGYADPSRARRAAELLEKDATPDVEFWIGAFAASEGRWGDLEQAIRTLEWNATDAELAGDSVGAGDNRALALALRGYSALRLGERERALSEIESALPRIADWGIHPFLRYEVGKLLLELGKPREAVRYLRSLDFENLPVGSISEYYLAQAYEALGDDEQALFRYVRFVRWWGDSDPDLRPALEGAREAIERLTGQGGGK